MNFIEYESAQKLRGGFYTEPDIAVFLARWVAALQPQHVLEPSCGDGAFLDALATVDTPRLRSVVACEMNPEEAGKARGRVQFGKNVRLEVRVGDFLRWFLFYSGVTTPFDGVLGNPPFIRYQYLPEEQQFLAEKVFQRFGLPFTKHTNAWVPFVIASLALLRPGGRLGMVVPSEIFHIPHAQSLRRYLAEQCARILILDPEKIWFGDTLQGTVLLLAEKKLDANEKGQGIAVIPAAPRQVLCTDPEELFQQAVYINGTTIEGKWMAVFLSAAERRLLAQLRNQKCVRRFSDLASVDVGIVTGANKFFLVPDSVVQEYDLEKWAHPMFGRSAHVQGIIYSRKDHEANKKAGLPSNFLWFQEEDVQSLPSNVRQYLDEGVHQKLHTRYKCRVRTPWYKVPSVSVAPIGMLKRAHHYPRLVLNRAGVYTTDTAYRIWPKGAKAEALVFGFVNSLTCLTAEMEGRHYGGGVLELVPSEIERLLIPEVTATRAELAAADQRFRTLENDSAFLRLQDAFILSRIGLPNREQDTLYAAWLKLRDRRHRVPANETTDDIES
ncbi:MAG: class I SAM-dependent methyltransferase [Verrucomicrobia bacterium]|nr:class I SAM-dependent methyltransferase [Verrucomicrobiota bacterium]MBU1910725.1 class I SAM-dependent methyltransferase [Verrucomicrobiota bacterium]